MGGLLFAPLLSLFLIEFRKYVRQLSSAELPPIPQELERAAQDARASLKQADHVDEYLERLAQVAELHDREFRGDGRGVRGFLRRALACDLGLYELGPRLVLTTHHAALAAGVSAIVPVSSREMGERAYNLAFLVGQYTGVAARALRIATHEQAPTHCERLFRARDVRAAAYLGALARRLESPSNSFAAAVLETLTALNTAAFVIPHLQWHPLFAFKVRFLLSFHALRSLRKLKAFGRGAGLLSDLALRRLSGHRDSARRVRALLSQAKLRNLLVHYAERDDDVSNSATRGDLSSIMQQLAAGEVPSFLSELVERVAHDSAADIASTLALSSV
ncbi:MAG TPA: hypothetical protein VEK07_12960 [Polyangiaceae bacterium]|nr:hypothetical protein [Polyangiaceae bacterium]